MNRKGREEEGGRGREGREDERKGVRKRYRGVGGEGKERKGSGKEGKKEGGEKEERGEEIDKKKG